MAHSSTNSIEIHGQASELCPFSAQSSNTDPQVRKRNNMVQQLVHSELPSAWLNAFNPTPDKFDFLGKVLLSLFLRNQNGGSIIDKVLTQPDRGKMPSFINKLTLQLSVTIPTEEERTGTKRLNPFSLWLSDEHEWTIQSAAKLKGHMSSIRGSDPQVQEMPYRPGVLGWFTPSGGIFMLYRDRGLGWYRTGTDFVYPPTGQREVVTEFLL